MKVHDSLSFSRVWQFTAAVLLGLFLLLNLAEAASSFLLVQISQLTTPEDTPLPIDPGAPSGSAIVILTPPTKGTITPGPNNTLTYTPSAHYSGSDSFTYSIDQNPQPTTANDDAATTPINTPVTISILGNDIDPQSDPLTPTLLTQPANGAAVLNANKTVTYTPNSGFTGQDTFTYQVNDGNGNTDTATVKVNVRLAANAATVHYLPPQRIGSSHANNPAHLWINTDHPNGATGTFRVPDGTTVQFTVTPTNTFIYNLSDGFGQTAVLNAVERKGLIVEANNPVNVQMVQENSNGQTFLNSKGLVALGRDFYAGQMGLLAGYESGGMSIISVLATEDNSQVTIQRPASATWNWLGTTTGTINVTLNAGQSYMVGVNNTAFDMTGARITANKPIAVSSGSFGAITYFAIDNGWDQLVPVESVGSRYIIVGSNSNPDVTDFLAVQNGTQVRVDNTLVATLNAGQYYRLDLTASQSLTETRIITTSAPVYAYQNMGRYPGRGENGLALVAPVNQSSRGLWRFRTPNPGTPDVPTIFLTTVSAMSSLVVTDVTGGGNTIVVNGPAGTPIAGDPTLALYSLNLTASREYRVQANAFVHVTMIPASGIGGGGGGIGYFGGFTPSDVTANDDNITVLTATPFVFSPLTNDTDGAGDPLTISNLGNASQGTVTNNGNGTLTYRSNAGYVGADSFQYTITDGNENFSTATVTVNVAALPTTQVTIKVAPVADDIPINAADASGQRGQNIPLTITVGNSADTDGSETRGSSVTIRNVPASVSFSAGVNNGDGTWTTPLTALSGLTARGSSDGQFTMTAVISNSDQATFSDSTSQTDTRDFTDSFVLNITGDNTPPTITPAPPLVRQQGSPGFVSVIATVNDSETPAGNLVVTATGVSGIVLQNITNTNGTITAFVAADCNALLENNSVVLQVRDAENAPATGNLVVNVTANTPPVLSYANPPLVNLGGALTINPATGPTDNGTITALTVHSVTPAFTGTIAVHPTTGVVSVSNAAPGGTYTVTIRATDNCGAPRDASFVLTVGKIATRIVLDSTPSPSGIGHAVRFTARVRTVPAGLGPPTGNALFYLGRTLLGTAPLNQGDATFITDALCVGTHQIYAAYRGNDRFEPSESALLTQVVQANDFTIHTHAGNGVMDFPNTSGAATASPFNSMAALAMERDGSLLIVDSSSRVVSRVNTRGEITRVAGVGSRSNNDGGDDGPALQANFRSPQGVAVDSKGNIYIADSAANRIRIITPDGIIRHFAGHEKGAPGFSGDGGIATAARFNSPYRLAVDAHDNLYVSDLDNHRVRRIDAVTKIVTTVAGNGTAFTSSLENRPATQVPVRGPVGLAFDRQGRLYIAVSGHHQIRRVDFTTGLITTVAGVGFAGDEGEGIPAMQAALNSPRGVAVDSVGNIYIADFYNHRLRMVDAATGKITTLAGQGSNAQGFSGDGGWAKLAKIYGPVDVVLAKDLAACGSGASALFLSDSGNRRARKLDKGVAPNQPPPAQH